MYKKDDGEVYYAGFLIKASLASNFNANFIFQQTYRKKYYHYIKIISQRSGQPGINSKEYGNLKFSITQIQEQNIIGKLFKSLDALLALYERKSKLLSQIKEYLLDNLFAENEYPNLRFKGFTNAWEQRKFKEILITYPFKQYIKEPQKNGSYKVIQQGNSPIIGYANGEPFQNYTNVVLFGDHTVSLYNPHAPFFIATDGVKILGTNLNFNGDFLYCILEKYKPKSQGYKRHYSILKNQKIYFTKNNQEQKKIANLFKLIDDYLALYESKLKQIKQIKKELLDTMFI